MQATLSRSTRSLAAPRAPLSRSGVVKVQAIAMPSPRSRRMHVRPAPKVFYDNAGKRIQPLPEYCDMGFRSGAARFEEGYGEVPKNMWELATNSMGQDLAQLRASYRFPDRLSTKPGVGWGEQATLALGNAMNGALAAMDEGLEKVGLLGRLEPPRRMTAEQEAQFRLIREKLSQLQLSAEDVHKQEERRIALHGDMAETPGWVKQPFLLLSWTLDHVYANNPIPKFWVLETVARIPYHAFSSILHLYESLGFWRAGAELRKVHFAEEWNEMHHLQIMESLGGDVRWFDRFLAEHMAVFYWWVLVVLYAVSPKLSYNFSQRVENHASDTYSVFVETNKDILATIPPPQAALNYYRGSDLYLFDEFQAGANGSATPRRPECNNLLDVFTNIRDDENEHVKTMVACQDETITQDLIKRSKRH